MTRRSYAEDPRLLDEVFALLGAVFPWFPAQVAAANARGLRWDLASTPFVHVEDGRVLSHVGVMDLAFVVGGTEVRLGGIHAVATHPEHRLRGHSRRLMEAALSWCDTRFATTMLTAEDPGLYTRYGFRVVPESRFAAPRPAGLAPVAARTLDLDAAPDLALLHRLLDEREPVSQRLAIVRDRDVFLFDTARSPILYVEEWDAAVVGGVRDGTLRLLDVVAPRMPPFLAVVGSFEEPFERIEVRFTPDRWGLDGFEALPAAAGDFLLVRGPFAAEGSPLALSPASSF